MYRKDSEGWLKHGDFIVLDMLCLQLAFILAYAFRGYGFNVYGDILYRNMAIFLGFADLVVIFTSGTMKSVLKRGHYKEFVTTLKNAVAVGALAIAYLFIIQEGQSFSRMILITTIVIYLILTYAIREIWKNSLHKKMENGGDKKLLIITSKAVAKNVVHSMQENNYARYLKNGFWHKIPENKKKSADYYVEFEKAVFIFELKSGMLGIGAKQQTPNVDLIDIFYKRNIEKAYKQLKNSELEYKGDKPVIKIFLLYESMPSNTQMIISSLPELFEKDSNCYVMTIEELEMFLTTYKKDRVKFDNIVSRLITSENGARRYKSVFEVLREYQATENMQFTGEKDYFEKIVHSYIGEHTE